MVLLRDVDHLLSDLSPPSLEVGELPSFASCNALLLGEDRVDDIFSWER